MKPTQEQLNDQLWWDLNSYGRDCVFYNSRLKRVEFANKDGRDCRHGGELVFSAGGWRMLAKRPTKPAFVPEVGDNVMVSLGKGIIKATGIANFKKAYFVQGNNWTETTTKVYPIKSERDLFVEAASKVLQTNDQEVTGLCNKSIEMFNSAANALYDSGLFCLKETDK